MSQVRPYIVVPVLIPQPTWGGSYIAEYKSLYPFAGLPPIGQSFECFPDSPVSERTSTEHRPVYAVASSTDPATMKFSDESFGFHRLNDLIQENPKAWLGEAVHRSTKLGILIKLNQARGNSFQVHIPDGASLGKWQPKPESWFFLESGKVTLGLKDPSNEGLARYKKALEEYQSHVEMVSKQVQSGAIDMKAAREQLDYYIGKSGIYDFVHTLTLARNQVVNLAQGGIHHSWEADPTLPHGNVVYEVQRNVYDPVATIRGFDKGNLLDDGTFRPVAIDDYIQALGLRPQPDVQTLIAKGSVVAKTSTYTIRRLFETPEYQSFRMTTSDTIANAWTETKGMFHHLMVIRGKIRLIAAKETLRVTTGHSIVIPASTGRYQISTLGRGVASVVQTRVL